jgi:large subunit ribosomal protein L30
MRALVQLRGEVNQSQSVRDTLEMLNLHKVNHCVLVPETPTYEGMITKVNDWVAHGEPTEVAVERLLRSRAEPASGAGPIDAEWIAEHTAYEDFEALASALAAEETTLREEGLSPTLRLHPPRGGHDGIKHPTTEGGQLGPHATDAISELLEAMR